MNLLLRPIEDRPGPTPNPYRRRRRPFPIDLLDDEELVVLLVAAEN